MRITALSGDLMFGSRVVEGLTRCGHEVKVVDSSAALGEALGNVLIVDLTAESFDGVEVLRKLAASGLLEGVRTIGVYAHVDAGTRTAALAAGFDLVVPRSRFARQMADLLDA